MKRIYLIALVTMIIGMAMKSDKPAYQLFDGKGRKADYSDLLQASLEADIVFFGELHNSPVCHWLQFELTRDLYSEVGDRLILGAEMFEADDQLILNEYLSGKIKERNFKEEAKLWDNYSTDYKPLVEFAVSNNLPFVATNVPRRYAAVVNKEGFEGLQSLDPTAFNYLPPVPIPYDPELKGYKDMLEMMGGAAGHGTDNIARAQALKDATMAYFILKNLSSGKLMIHFNGTYHTNNYEGIIWYIRQTNPDLRLLSIASVEQDTIGSLTEENSNLADFTLCIPSSMTKTY
jgi:uncharacterized iron-regulated protein